MRYSDFLKAVQAKTVPPVVIFFGEERFQKRLALDALIETYLPGDVRQFNFRSLSAEDLRDSSFLDDASTLPMFHEWKILCVKDAAALEKIFGRIGDYLQQYLEQPSPQTILVFEVFAWEGRSKLKPLLTKNGAVVEFNALSEKEIPSWIVGHLRSYQFQMDASAIEVLVERQGTDLQKIAGELDKLMLLRQKERRIGLEDVEASVGYSPTATVWEWSEALLDQNADQAMAMLDELLEKGEQPVYCVALLAKQYEKMIITKEMVAQKIPQATISKKINKPVYFLGKYLAQLARFSMTDLVKAMQVLAYTDRGLKMGLAPDRLLLEWMTVQLCRLKMPVPPLFDVPLQL